MPRPPAVLIHGAGGCAATWAPVLPHWGPGDHAVDLPGRGSAQGVPAASAAEAARALEGLPEGALLVGHSFGGAVAIEAALAAPERWAGLVLVGSGARLRVAPAILEAVAAATPSAPFRLDFAFGPDADLAVVAAYHAAAAPVPPATALADWRACDAFDRRERLGELALPVLVVHGDADRLTPPRFQEWLEQAIPGTSRAVVPGAGHMLPWEAPEALVAAVDRWWADR